MTPRCTPLFVLSLLGFACGPGSSGSGGTGSSGDDTTTANTDPTSGEMPTTTGDPSSATMSTMTSMTSMTSMTMVTGETTTSTDATSTGGETTMVDPTGATTGEPECPAQLPEDGTPCAFEGQFCGGPCDDPCAFCNVTKCEGGMWQHLEVFPNNCLGCDMLCEFVVPAGCEAGPPTQETCVAGCQDLQAGDCMLAFNKMLSCIGGEPMFVCGEDGRPVVEACLPEFLELQACMAG